MFSFYKVGGCIRDKLLNLQHKDIDFVVVGMNINSLQSYLIDRGFVIIKIFHECLTIKTKFLSDTEIDFPFKLIRNNIYDFNVGRKDLEYNNSTRVPKICVGSLYDDMYRRDFTINSLAEDANGNIIDYFNGISDINNKVVKTIIDPNISVEQDPLRILRGIRFAITLNFILDEKLEAAINNFNYTLMNKITTDKIIRELKLCFSHNTLATLRLLNKFNNLETYLFDNNIKLVPKIL